MAERASGKIWHLRADALALGTWRQATA